MRSTVLRIVRLTLRAPAGLRSSMNERISSRSPRARGVRRTLIVRGGSRSLQFPHPAQILLGELVRDPPGSPTATHRRVAPWLLHQKPSTAAQTPTYPDLLPEAPGLSRLPVRTALSYEHHTMSQRSRHPVKSPIRPSWGRSCNPPPVSPFRYHNRAVNVA